MQESLESIWLKLLTERGQAFYYDRGFFAVGDAEKISGFSLLQNRLVLVERTERKQINHWEHQAFKIDYPLITPKILSNGDDGRGNLNRAAPKLKRFQ